MKKGLQHAEVASDNWTGSDNDNNNNNSNNNNDDDDDNNNNNKGQRVIGISGSGQNPD